MFQVFFSYQLIQFLICSYSMDKNKIHSLLKCKHFLSRSLFVVHRIRNRTKSRGLRSMSARRLMEAMNRDAANAAPRPQVLIVLAVRSNRGRQKLEVNQTMSGRGLKVEIKKLLGIEVREDIVVRRNNNGRPGENVVYLL